jgi:fumarate reductase subunit D
MKRSNAPIFWSLFGAGGMISALIGAALVFITGIGTPLGVVLPADGMSYGRMLAFAHNWAAKIFIFVVVSLFLWHAVHRIYHTLHDFGIHGEAAPKLACYGLALVGTLIAAYALLAIGF